MSTDGELEEVVSILEKGATYGELTDPEEGPGLSKYKARRYVQEILPNRGYTVQERRANSVGKKEFKIVDDGEAFVNYYEPKDRSPTQGVTRELNDYLDQLEAKVAELRQDFDGLSARGIHEINAGNQDIVIPRMDDHFGALIKDEHGDVIFNSEIAEEMVQEHIEWVLGLKRQKEEAGVEFDGVHLVLGGDIVTGETIYEGQAHQIDEKLPEQLARSTRVYTDVIKKLAEEFEFVQVVCNAGNHGEIRASGSSKKANVDRFLYNNLEFILAETDYDNIGFVYSDRATYTNFKVRNHRGHLRHGQNVSSHIGTSRPESDWRSYLLAHEFDIAYRGHYHGHSVEHINGRPVLLTPSIKPVDEHEETLGYFRKPMACVHGISDENTLEWMEYFYFDEE